MPKLKENEIFKFYWYVVGLSLRFNADFLC
jgi:hypothetical protein